MSGDYISREDAVRAIESYYKERSQRSRSEEMFWVKVTEGSICYSMINIMSSLPSADVVEVVRCKDCRFVGTDATCCLVCNRNGMGLRPFHVYHDDFCSYAERREDAEIH